MIAQKRDKEIGRPVLEDKTQRQAAATFKKILAQFADGQSAVNVGMAEDFDQLTQCRQALQLNNLGQFSQSSYYGGVDG
jgi:hypothetical protein